MTPLIAEIPSWLFAALWFILAKAKGSPSPTLHLANVGEGTHDRPSFYTDAAISTRHLLFKVGSDATHITVKGRWRIPYDPRDEAQDPDDPSTWVYTNNADVCFYDYLRGVPIKIGDGSIARLMGVNAEDDEIVQDAAIAAMNECDIDVPRATGFTLDCDVVAGNRHVGTADVSGILIGMPVSGGVLAAGTMVVSVDTSGTFFTVDRDPTGTDASIDLTFGDSEKKYTTNGCFDLDAVPSTVVDHFLSATAGRLHDVGGDLVIRAGAWEEVRPPPVIKDGALMYACVLTFVESTSSDLDFYEVGVNNSNTIDPSLNVDVDGSQFPCPKGTRICYIYRPAVATEYLWIRAVDYSKNRSTFVLVGNISSYLKLPAGNLTEQNSSAVSLTGGSLTGMTTLGTSSTRRRKKNIRTIEDPLAIVRALRGVRFDSKDGKVKGDVGLIAEEVAPILPTLVTHDEHGKINGLDYGKLGGVLVGAIKQLDARTRPRRRRRSKRKD